MILTVILSLEKESSPSFHLLHRKVNHKLWDLLKAPLEEIAKLDLGPVFWVQFLPPFLRATCILSLHFWAGAGAFGGHANSSCSPFPSPSPTPSCPRNSTDAVGDWGESDANSEFQAQLLIVWGLKGEFLQKGSEENKQLSLGQLFSEACPLSWKTRT